MDKTIESWDSIKMWVSLVPHFTENIDRDRSLLEEIENFEIWGKMNNWIRHPQINGGCLLQMLMLLTFWNRVSSPEIQLHGLATASRDSSVSTTPMLGLQAYLCKAFLCGYEEFLMASHARKTNTSLTNPSPRLVLCVCVWMYAYVYMCSCWCVFLCVQRSKEDVGNPAVLLSALVPWDEVSHWLYR